MEIAIPAARLRRALTILVFALTLLSFAGTLGTIFLQMGTGGFVRIFSVDAEMSLPTWYSTAALALSAALLAAVAAAVRARKDTRDLFAWTTLSLIFAFLSADEIVGFHESLSNILHDRLHLGGYLRFTWVLAAFVLVPLVGAAFIPFLLRLAPRRRRQFVLSGLLFVGGAVVVEMIGAKVFTAAGEKLTLSFALCFHLEELMEMLGVALFNAALIEHLAEILGPAGLRLRFTDD